MPTATTHNQSAILEQHTQLSKPKVKLTRSEESDHANDETKEGDCEKDESMAGAAAPAAKHARETGLGLSLREMVRVAGVALIGLGRDGDNMRIAVGDACGEAIIGVPSRGRLGLAGGSHLRS